MKKTFILLILEILLLQGCSFTQTATNVMIRIDNAIKINKEKKAEIAKAKIKNMRELTKNGFLISNINGTYRSPLNNKAYEIEVTEPYIEETKITDANSYNEMPYTSSCNGNQCNIELYIFYRISKGIYQNTSIKFTLTKNGNYWYIVYGNPANQDVFTYKIGYMNRGNKRYVRLHNSTYDIGFEIENIY